MAHTYTPGLKVARRVRHRARRVLPIAGEVRVKQGDAVAALARCCDASVNAIFDLTTDDPPSTVQLQLVRLGAIPLSRDMEVQVDGRWIAQFGIPSLETCDDASCSSTGPCEEEYQVESVQLPGGGATAFDLELRIWVLDGPGFFDAFDGRLLPEIEIAWIDEPS